MALARAYKVGVFDTSTPLATGATSTVTTPIPILYGIPVHVCTGVKAGHMKTTMLI